MLDDEESLQICWRRRITRRCFFCCCLISNKVHPLENILEIREKQYQPSESAEEVLIHSGQLVQFDCGGAVAWIQFVAVAESESAKPLVDYRVQLSLTSPHGCCSL